MTVILALAMSAGLAGPLAGDEDPGAQLDAIAAEFVKARQDCFAAMQEADEADQARLYEELYPNASEYASRAFDIADEHPDTEVAKKALLWIVQNSERDAGAAAIDLVDSFIEDEDMAAVGWALLYSGHRGAVSILTRILDESPHHEVQGVASYALGTLLLESGRVDEGREHMQRVVDEFEDVENHRGVSIAVAAERDLFEMDHLVVGEEAPEIVGTDTDGVEFKLSDYRGKVVFLDFWGHW